MTRELEDRWLVVQTVRCELRLQSLERLKAPKSIIQNDRDLLKERQNLIKEKGLEMRDFKKFALRVLRDNLDEMLEDMTDANCSGCKCVDYDDDGEIYKCKEGHEDTVNPGLCPNFNAVDEETEDQATRNQNHNLLELKEMIKRVEQW